MATWKMADSNMRPQKADTTAAAAGYTRSLHVANNTTSNSNSNSETTQQQNFRSRFSVHQRETKQIGPIRIQSAVASFVFKGEDRFDMWRCTNFVDSCSTSIIEDEHSDDDDDANSSNNTNSSSSRIKIKSKLDRAKQRYCGSPAAATAAAATAAAAASPPPISPVRDDHISIGSREDGSHVISNNTNSRSRPQLLAYAGVFDGHSGHAASEYCANKGLLSHIILETAAQSTTTTTTTTSSTNTRTYSNRRAIGGGGVHNKPNIEVPWLNQNLHYTKTTATAATSTQDVGNKINNNIDDKDWCPIQNALQETVSKLASSPLEVAHARAFCSAQTRFASGSTPLTLKQVAEKVSEMNKQQQQQQQQRRNDARLTFKQLVMQVIEMNYKQQQERRNAFKQLVKQVIEMNKQQQQRRSGGYYTRRGAAVAAAAVTAAGSNNTLSSSPGFKGLLRRRSGSMEHETDIPGGTTACTLSIYCQEEEEGEIGAFGEDEVSVHDDDDDDDCVRLSVFAIVANCGDSRLITDHGTGGTIYHAITTDHRPNEPSEAVRLAECCKRGYGHLSCQRWTPATTNQGDLQWLHSPVERLFPGGLAVSRTIGDTSYCKAAVPVPDVYRLCLGSGINSIPTTTTTAIKLASPNNRRSLLTSAASTPTFAGSRRSVMSACTTSTADSTGGAGHARTHRFVLATDGLWDMLTIQEVGILAARLSHAHDIDEHEVAEEVPTHVSAMRIMQECLTVCQETGHYDDITIVVIDVTV